MAVIDSYSESNHSGSNYEIWATSGRYEVGQSITGDGNVVGRITWYLSKLGSPTGNAVAKIYAHSGTFGSSSLPTGAALATSDAVDISTLSSGSYALKDFPFTGANQITLTNGTKYFVTIEYTNGSGVNTVKVAYDSSSPTHGGNAAENDSRFGGWTARSGNDMIFYVHSTGSSPSASLSPSSSNSPSASPSLSISPSSSPSASLSPSPLPPPGVVLVVGKPGIDALRNSDPEKNMFDSRYGTLKYFTKQAVNISFNAGAPDLDISATGAYSHNLGYYPFCEVFVRVYVGATPAGNYEYCPFFGAGATVNYSAVVKITTSQIVVYGMIEGASSSVWHFDFLIFIYKNNLNL